MQAYKAAKTVLFAPDFCPIAILNGDDEVGREIARLREESGKKTLFYGLNTPSDAFAVIATEGLHGTECVLNIEDNLCRVSLKLMGQHNVYNALAAASCAFELGFSLEAVAKGLSALEGVEGRLQRIGNHHGAEIYVDFAHTPDGLKKSINTLKKYAKGRVVCLFGCGGNRDRSKRAIMGEIAAKYADFSILTSDSIITYFCNIPLPMVRSFTSVTVPETLECTGALINPPASPMSVPTKTLSPFLTVGLAGAPICCERGIYTV
jgi:UDP-N-acetylmuramoyl-L-alanyl-D-glutamate--2,6-diaminopimelate ligase